jgi:hypothetical protein
MIEKGMLREMLNPLKKVGYTFTFLTAHEFKCGVMARIKLKLPGPNNDIFDYPDYVIAYHIWFGPWNESNDGEYFSFRKHVNQEYTNPNDGMLLLVQPIGIGSSVIFKSHKNKVIKKYPDLSNPKSDITKIPDVIVEHTTKMMEEYIESLGFVSKKTKDLIKLVKGDA